MSPELEALGRRAVACKGWRWMPGMLAYWESGEDGKWLRERVTEHRPNPSVTDIPDLSDPATLGCLLVLVREACEHPGYEPLAVVPPNWDRGYGRWRVVCQSRSGGPTYTADAVASTEAGALVAALEGEQ